ncbi:MAG: hypothetical protein WBI37_02250 [Tepidanaerobacteraceae bacterium]|jgi:rubrerythrin
MEMKSSYFHFIRIVKIKKGDGVMPTFANPFSGNVERKVSKQELIQAIRLDIAAELEAIFIYDAHIQATDDVFVKRVLSDIRDEEKAHVGELMTLLRHLDPTEADFFLEGEEEVREMMEELGIKEPPKPGSTVGSLLKEE